MENPTVLEFETPTAETYPLWHSPGYWYAGAKTVFSWHKQIHGISESLEEYGKIAVRAIGFIGGAIVLFALGMSKGKRAQRWRISFWLLAWPLAGCAMYSIVRLHPRYVAAFLLILCLEVYRALVFRVGRRVSIGVCAIALLVVMTPLFLRASKTFATSVRQLRHPVDEEYVVAAHNLQHLGLQPGDKVAVAGFALNCFYARYDRLRIVSQILTPDDFWRLNPSDAKRVEDRLASIGVKALIVFDHPARKQEAGWTDVGAFGGGSLSVLLLQPASEPSHLPNLALGPGLADKSGAQSPVDAGDRNPQASTPPDSDE
jgi:hypothetical protein